MENAENTVSTYQLYVVYCKQGYIHYNVDLINDCLYENNDRDEIRIILLGKRKLTNAITDLYKKRYGRSFSFFGKVLYENNGWNMYSLMRRGLIPYLRMNRHITSISFIGPQAIIEKMQNVWDSLTKNSSLKGTKVLLESPTKHQTHLDKLKTIVFYRTLWLVPKYKLEKILFGSMLQKVKIPKDVR